MTQPQLKQRRNFFTSKTQNKLEFKLFANCLYGLVSLKNQTFIDLFDLIIFVDWMGKADFDDVLGQMKKKCFQSVEYKLEEEVDTIENANFAEILLVLGKLI